MTALLLAASGPFALADAASAAPVGSRPAPPRVFLPAADASALARGDSDRTIRDAFLGADAPGAMLVRGLPGYAAARREASPRSPGARARTRRPPRPRPGMDGERREFSDDRSTKTPPGLIFPPPRLSRRLRPAHRRGAERVEARPRPGRAVRPGHARVARGAARVRGRSRATRPPEARRPPRVRHRGFFRAAADAGESLDHFHVYVRRESEDAAAKDATREATEVGSPPSDVEKNAKGRKDDVDPDPRDDPRADDPPPGGAAGRTNTRTWAWRS